jgi:cytoskeletal protein CcmA (bactofilin family)
MMNEAKGSIKISGSGSAGGGVFEEVRISGSGKITGDIECNEFHISGSGKAEGNVKAKEYRTSGSSHIIGDLEAEDIKVSGSAHFEGNVKCDSVKISGSTRIGKNLEGGEIDVSGSTNVDGGVHGEHIRISGSINVKGDCEAEEFIAKGGFRIGGLLNADNIEISIGGSCSAREIGGERIEVKEFIGGAFFLNKIFGLLFNQGLGLKTQLIEGDDIYLEYTVAKVVRGNNITIGKGCIIDTVEYKSDLKVLDNGKVENQTKIN